MERRSFLRRLLAGGAAIAAGESFRVAPRGSVDAPIQWQTAMNVSPAGVTFKSDGRLGFGTTDIESWTTV